MPDQWTVATKLLEKMGLAKWHVVEPVRGGLRGNVWIQNEEEKLDAYVEISPADCHDLSDEEKEKRVRTAIANAKKRY